MISEDEMFAIRLHYTPMEMIPEHVAHMLADDGRTIPIQAGADLSVYFDLATGEVVFDASHNPAATRGSVIRFYSTGYVNVKFCIYSPLFRTGKSRLIGWGMNTPSVEVNND